MLKKLPFFTMLLAAFTVNAQFSVESLGGEPIVDGQIVNVGDPVSPTPSLDFYVTNENPTTDINMVIEFVSAINDDGTNLEICFGLCYTGVMVGQSYPINDFVIIEPGQTQTSDGDHFKYIPDGSGDVVTYVFRFYEVDASGNEIGDDLTMTYVYDEEFLGVNENNVVNASIVSTLVNNTVEVNAKEALTFTMYNIQGKIVNQTKLEQGVSRVNVAELAAQTYLVVLTNSEGASQTTKIIVK